MKDNRFIKVVASALCVAATGLSFADGPWEIEGGWSNEVLNAENKTEYVVAFTNTSQSYTLTIQDNVYAIQYLVVGGGGGGGCHHGGGGGAGGMLTNDAYPVSSGDVLTITVGAGGAGGSNNNSVDNARGKNGGDSSISVNGESNIIAYGGGGGGGLSNSADSRDGLDGGCGGGGAGSKSGLTSAVYGGAGVSGQGFDGNGWVGAGANYAGRGGGGAGAGGLTGNRTSAKDGGAGLASLITGEEVYYAGGGGGGGAAWDKTAGANGAGGTGGGGNGGFNGSSGVNGTPGTGGGGGGGGIRSGGALGLGGKGGSGIVIVRYAVTDTSGGIVVTSDGGVYGTPEPNYGSYVTMPETSEYTCDEYVQVDDGVRAYCTGWKLFDGNGTLIRSSDNPAAGETAQKAILGGEAAGGTLRWQWEVRYLLTLELDGVEPGEAVADWYAVDRSGYYAEGATVSIEAVPAANYTFSKWMFDGEYSETTTNPLSLEIGDEPIVAAASFVAVGITSWYGGQTVGGVEKTHYFDNSTVGQTYSITCPKYVVTTENVQRKRCIGYTLKTLPDGAESALLEAVDGGNDVMTAQIEFSAPVLVSWKWIDEFHVTTTVQGNGALKEDLSGWYTNNAKVAGIEVASKRLFKGWGGFSGDRSGSVVTATVANAAMTVTAYFAETPKENLVLNGDFEMNSDSSNTKYAIANFNRLNAGSWRVDMDSGEPNFPCGILAAQSEDSFPSNVRTYGNLGLSGMVSTGKSTNVGVVSCEVNLPHSGIYEFSCVTRRGSNVNSIGSNTWSVRVELVKGEDAIHVGDVFVDGNNVYTLKSVQAFVRGGTYRLKLSVPVENINGEKNVACTAFDEVSFRLVSGMPLVIFVR